MSCPACGADRWKGSRVLPTLRVLVCGSCGLLTSDTDTAGAVSYSHFDAGTYDAAIGRLRREQSSEVLRFARRHVDRGDWLDVGCGPGYLLAEAAASGFDVRGIEPDAIAAERARSLIGVERIREGTFGAAEESPVDVISTLDVLEHVAPADLSAFVDAVRGSLRRDGAWIIKVPSAEGLCFKLAHAFGLTGAIERLWQVGYASPHLLYFARASLQSLLQRHGFHILGSRHMRELSVCNAIPRLTLAGAVSRAQAVMALPAVGAINLIDALRGKSDSLLVVARRGGA